MGWNEVVRDYPWVVIDPSSLIGHSTPTTAKKLRDKHNPLWRQFYVSWMVQQGKDQGKGEAGLLSMIGDLNEINEKSKDKGDRAKYDKAKQWFEDNGDFEGFGLAIREIKDAVKEKQEQEPGLNAGLALTAEIAVAATQNKAPQGVLLDAAANLRGGEREQFVKEFNNFLTHAEEFFKKAEAESTWATVYDLLIKNYEAMQSRQSRLRDWLGKYQSVVPYITADSGHARNSLTSQALRDGNAELLDLYGKVETGELEKIVWACVSKYLQSLASVSAQMANSSEAMVTVAKNQVGKDVADNMAAYYPEACTALLAVKTVVGIGTSIAGFFPPIGTAVAMGLSSTMTIVDGVSQALMIYMAKNDPDTVLKSFGMTYDAPTDEKSELVEYLGKYGTKALEFLHSAGEGAHFGVDRTFDGIKDAMAESARTATEQTLKTSGQAIAGIGAAITVASLAYEWYEWSEQVQAELRNRDGLTGTDVQVLQAGLEGAWKAQRSNGFWDIKTATYAGMTGVGGDYKVVINGVPGTIRRADFVFSPDDRGALHATILAKATKKYANGRLDYHGASVYVDWASAAFDAEVDETMQFKVNATNRGRVYAGKVALHADGFAEIAELDLPDDTAELNRMAQQYSSLDYGGSHFQLDWASAAFVSKTHTWNLTCEVGATLVDGSNHTLRVFIRRDEAPELRAIDDQSTKGGSRTLAALGIQPGQVQPDVLDALMGLSAEFEDVSDEPDLPSIDALAALLDPESLDDEELEDEPSDPAPTPLTVEGESDDDAQLDAQPDVSGWTKYHEEFEAYILSQAPFEVRHATNQNRFIDDISWTNAANRDSAEQSTWTFSATLTKDGQPLPGGPHQLTIVSGAGGSFLVLLDPEQFDRLETALTQPSVDAIAQAMQERQQVVEPVAQVPSQGEQYLDQRGQEDSTILPQQAVSEERTLDGAIYELMASAEPVWGEGGNQAVTGIEVDWNEIAEWTEISGGWSGTLTYWFTGSDEGHEAEGTILHATSGEAVWLELPAGAAVAVSEGS